MMSKPKAYASITEIKKDLRILKLKKDISYELLSGNKEAIQETMQPLNLLNKVVSPFKKVIVAYLIKKVFR
ncbi:hypothetical protein MTsPCn5_00690 [Croceitalea sp. MTPC5]|uniref:DUF6327 family protein n=1 Tax=Croceitalea sp. MTPC5 TaxID=3056565 RepID=UPI002B3E87DD|nr:hypothetical protein MTsPCn5_00690 [Croceitalea sp. MTPC5]